jgi:hypothetical protein
MNGKPQIEQMFSGLAPIADMEADIGFVRSVPIGDIAR